MMELNEVRIVGNLVAKPEVRYTTNGKAVSDISLGVNERRSVDGEDRSTVAFIDATVWGKSAEALAKLANKGTEIFLEGSLRQDKFTDKSGVARSKIVINSDRWQFTQRLTHAVDQVPTPGKPVGVDR